MIVTERQSVMTVRENVRQIVDLLPDESLDDVLDYLAEISEPEQGLSAETQAGIAEGLDDIAQGRTITLEQYRRQRGL